MDVSFSGNNGALLPLTEFALLVRDAPPIASIDMITIERTAITKIFECILFTLNYTMSIYTTVW